MADTLPQFADDSISETPEHLANYTATLIVPGSIILVPLSQV